VIITKKFIVILYLEGKNVVNTFGISLKLTIIFRAVVPAPDELPDSENL
jgi:hypothetical protein